MFLAEVPFTVHIQKLVNTLIWLWYINCAMTYQIGDQTTRKNHKPLSKLIIVTACDFLIFHLIGFSSQHNKIPEIILVLTIFRFSQ